MDLDRLLDDPEFACDLLVEFSRDDVIEYFALARRQQRKALLHDREIRLGAAQRAASNQSTFAARYAARRALSWLAAAVVAAGSNLLDCSCRMVTMSKRP